MHIYKFTKLHLMYTSYALILDYYSSNLFKRKLFILLYLWFFYILKYLLVRINRSWQRLKVALTRLEQGESINVENGVVDSV